MEYFKNFWISERKELMLRTLVILDKLFKKNNIDYCLIFGTLLGAIRHHGFIPWDDDVDILVFDENRKKIIKLLKSEKSFDYVNNFGLFDKIWHKETLEKSKDKYGYPFVDIFYAKMVKENFSIYDARFKRKYSPNEIFPIKYATFETCALPIPNAYNKICIDEYGENCFIEAKSSRVDHKKCRKLKVITRNIDEI